MSTHRLTPFSYGVLTLVGEGGAGAHDLVQMMRRGSVYWSAATSQWYAEPKRLAQLGYLDAERTPGRTHERTHYRLTDKGREALRESLATPPGPPRIQNEAIIQVLAGAQLGEGEQVAANLEALRAELHGQLADLEEAERIAETLPGRRDVLLANHRMARGMVEAQLAWIDEVQDALRGGRRGAASSAGHGGASGV